MSEQAPGAAVLIRPRHFFPNPETASDNAFQSLDHHRDELALAAAAYDEVTAVAAALQAAGVTVHVFDNDEHTRHDSVFPNNWFSTHAGGSIALYPMYSQSRRTERRPDVIELLRLRYQVQDVVDYSGWERDDVFLEGTGAMVLDHDSRVAYAVRSRRANPVALQHFCITFGFEPMAFDATDEAGVPVYHTNVMMCIATDFAMIGLEMISDVDRREQVRARLAASGREVIDLSRAQIRNFAGNAIELQGSKGRILALSRRAHASLTDGQRAVINRSCTTLPLDVPTIELAGGSVRCMIAGIHLRARPETHGQEIVLPAAG